MLDAYCPPAGRLSAAGAYFHQHTLERFTAGQEVDVELVPEPENPWDSRAVALDIDGRRVAYLQAGSARWWHDVVRAANIEGFAVYVKGRIDAWTADDSTYLGLSISTQGWESLEALAISFGLLEEHRAVMKRLTPVQRDLMREDNGYTPDPRVLASIDELRAEHPRLTWGPKREGTLARRMPFWMGYFVRKEIEAERAHARLIRRTRSLLRREIRRREADVRVAAREEARRQRAARERRALELRQEGLPIAAVAAQLGVTPGQVSGIYSRARKDAGEPSTWHREAQDVRRHDAAEALRLQRTGLTKPQIATSMGRSVQSIKELLSDARFYERPSGYPERLRLAEACQVLRNQGVAKAEIITRLDVSRMLALRAFRDSSILQPTDR